MKRKVFVLVVVVLLVVILSLVFLYLNSNRSSSQTGTNTSGNQILDSYRTQLPTLSNLAQNSVNPVDIRNYAVALYATGDIEGAKEQYLREVELNPNDDVLLNNLGNVYRDSGEYQKAIDSYQKSIVAMSDQLNAYVNLANLYIYVLEQRDMGYGVLINGIESSPNNKESLLLSLANAYREAGLKDLAIARYNELLTINPDNDVVKNILSTL